MNKVTVYEAHFCLLEHIILKTVLIVRNDHLFPLNFYPPGVALRRREVGVHSPVGVVVNTAASILKGTFYFIGLSNIFQPSFWVEYFDTTYSSYF